MVFTILKLDYKIKFQYFSTLPSDKLSNFIHINSTFRLSYLLVRLTNFSSHRVQHVRKAHIILTICSVCVNRPIRVILPVVCLGKKRPWKFRVMNHPPVPLSQRRFGIRGVVLALDFFILFLLDYLFQFVRISLLYYLFKLNCAYFLYALAFIHNMGLDSVHLQSLTFLNKKTETVNMNLVGFLIVFSFG